MLSALRRDSPGRRRRTREDGVLGTLRRRGSLARGQELPWSATQDRIHCDTMPASNMYGMCVLRTYISPAATPSLLPCCCRRHSAPPSANKIRTLSIQGSWNELEPAESFSSGSSLAESYSSKLPDFHRTSTFCGSWGSVLFVKLDRRPGDPIKRELHQPGERASALLNPRDRIEVVSSDLREFARRTLGRM